MTEKDHFTFEEIELLPEKPGVYLITNSLKQMFYIGETVNIQARIQSHFIEMEKHLKRDVNSFYCHALYADYKLQKCKGFFVNVLEKYDNTNVDPDFKMLLRDRETYWIDHFAAKHSWKKIYNFRRRYKGKLQYKIPARYTEMRELYSITKMRLYLEFNKVRTVPNTTDEEGEWWTIPAMVKAVSIGESFLKTAIDSCVEKGIIQRKPRNSRQWKYQFVKEESVENSIFRYIFGI
ncbi:MAG: GIY-YIG nuclease family protein [Candidatus Odinarchaeota archaeon]